MLVKSIAVLTIAMLMALSADRRSMAAETGRPIMRIFEFVLAPGDVEAFMEAGKKNLQISVRDEPGVLSMYCAADPTDPAKLYVVEVYKDQAAYQAHVESPHFKEFLEAIKGKIISRRAIETNPEILGAKSFTWARE